VLTTIDDRTVARFPAVVADGLPRSKYTNSMIYVSPFTISVSLLMRMHITLQQS
jgi:hypothetical protein